MKIASIVGARPQFIKLAPLSIKLRKVFQEVIIHTGQHYDFEMSPIFFKELKIPYPDYNLNVKSASRAWQLGKMIIKLEEVLKKIKPQLVIVFGDTTSTLAGAITADIIGVPAAHIEAGMRSYTNMPEESNRVATDHLSDLLFCSTNTAVNNLKKEGITKNVFLTGDIMYEAAINSLKLLPSKVNMLKKWGVSSKQFLLLTIHRAENTENIRNIKNILKTLNKVKEKIIFPIHPRTKKLLAQVKNLKVSDNIKVIKPVSYLEMLFLIKSARLVLTDSGGVQKEAYFFKTPCITLRDETEWIETVKAGWNTLAGSDSSKIIKAVRNFKGAKAHPFIFGDGRTSDRIVEVLKKFRVPSTMFRVSSSRKHGNLATWQHRTR